MTKFSAPLWQTGVTSGAKLNAAEHNPAPIELLASLGIRTADLVLFALTVGWCVAVAMEQLSRI